MPAIVADFQVQGETAIAHGNGQRAGRACLTAL
jgi:hypothetical protein